MGFSHGTYVAYGVHVPQDKWHKDSGYAGAEGERIDGVIREVGLNGTDVGHMSAGSYDRDQLFLVCSPPYVHDKPETHVEIELGSFRVYRASWFSTSRCLTWNGYLKKVADAAGYGDLGEPGWIVVPDMS